jgi:hypothetical protein
MVRDVREVIRIEERMGDPRLGLGQPVQRTEMGLGRRLRLLGVRDQHNRRGERPELERSIPGSSASPPGRSRS